MRIQHWIGLAVILFIAYIVGVKYPTIGQSVLSKVGM